MLLNIKTFNALIYNYLKCANVLEKNKNKNKKMFIYLNNNTINI